MFSLRTNWRRRPNRITQLVDERRKSGKPISDLTVSNPTEAGFVYPSEEILSALAQAPSLHYTPDPRGLLSARESIADYYAAKHTDVHPERSRRVHPERSRRVHSSNIILTASTSEAYSFLFTLLCGAGENVLAPVPSYPLFEYLAQVNDVQIHPYNLRYDGEWHIDFDSVRRAVSPSTKAIVIVSPHNPTGMILKRDELQALNEIALQYNLALIVDEVFADYGFGEDERRVQTTAANAEVLTFTLNGISKLCGLPQLKLGWIVVSGREKAEALHRLEIIADTFLSVGTPVQTALPTLLICGEVVRQQIRERVRVNLRILKQSLQNNSPLSLLRTEGGWYAILKIPNTKTEEEWALQLLEESGVYVFPGYFFEFQEDGYVVLSLLTTTATFERGVNEIVRRIS